MVKFLSCLFVDEQSVSFFWRVENLPFCIRVFISRPGHHTLVGTALQAAYHGKIDLLPALKEMFARGRKVPGEACGFWGSRGAAVSGGMFMSIISGPYLGPYARKLTGPDNMVAVVRIRLRHAWRQSLMLLSRMRRESC